LARRALPVGAVCSRLTANKERFRDNPDSQQGIQNTKKKLDYLIKIKNSPQKYCGEFFKISILLKNRILTFLNSISFTRFFSKKGFDLPSRSLRSSREPLLIQGS
jgi:hypothetical protein